MLRTGAAVGWRRRKQRISANRPSPMFSSAPSSHSGRGGVRCPCSDLYLVRLLCAVPDDARKTPRSHVQRSLSRWPPRLRAMLPLPAHVVTPTQLRRGAPPTASQRAGPRAVFGCVVDARRVSLHRARAAARRRRARAQTLTRVSSASAFSVLPSQRPSHLRALRDSAICWHRSRAPRLRGSRPRCGTAVTEGVAAAARVAVSLPEMTTALTPDTAGACGASPRARGRAARRLPQRLRRAPLYSCTWSFLASGASLSAFRRVVKQLLRFCKQLSSVEVSLGILSQLLVERPRRS